MNDALRTIKSVIETSLRLEEQKMNELFIKYEGKKVFQLVCRVTGKLNSDKTDYSIENGENHFGKPTLVLSGKKGFNSRSFIRGNLKMENQQTINYTHRIYGKHKNNKTFKPMNMREGKRVTNLIYASMFNESDAKKCLADIQCPENSDWEFEIRKI